MVDSLVPNSRVWNPGAGKIKEKPGGQESQIMKGLKD